MSALRRSSVRLLPCCSLLLLCCQPELFPPLLAPNEGINLRELLLEQAMAQMQLTPSALLVLSAAMAVHSGKGFSPSREFLDGGT